MKLTAESTLPATATGAQSSRRDRDLQIARRLDWRYLLPDPRLGRLALIGRPEGVLLEALQLFSEKLTVIPSSAQPAPPFPANCDVAVVCSSEPGAVALASSALKPGGCLYWELGATRWRFSLRRCHAALRKHGFEEIKVYWCRPSFEECLEMIPLSEPLALAFALSRRLGGTRRWLFQAAVRLLAGIAIPAGVVSCRSVVARKTEGSSSP
jgi:hypothetical protein